MRAGTRRTHLNCDCEGACRDCAALPDEANLGFDQIGKEKYHPNRLRIELILALVAEGFGSQITLAGGLAHKSYWPAYVQWSGPGLTYILWRSPPRLHERGIDARLLQLSDVR